mmetsp:Transcript_6111/g.5464  ORF Transcript_6111/g.5464 Transcript_6111/m.5464 type:complete len:83 (-) Transcript_6111:2109-2357(-)
MKLKHHIPSFERNVIKSNFLNELICFYDHFLSQIDTVLTWEEPEQTMGIEAYQSITAYILKLWRFIETASHNLEQQKGEENK